MATQSPYTPPGVNQQLDTGLVLSPASQQNPDGSVVPSITGRHGDFLVSEVHGKRYQSAARGNLYWGTSGNTGVSILAPAQTTGGFVLYNSSTNKILEVHKIKFTTASVATVVVAGMGLEGSLQVPSGTLTGTVTTPMPLATVGVAASASGSAGKVYGACTLVAMTYIGGLAVSDTATTSTPGVAEVDLDGTLLVGPGYSINVVSSITQSTAKMIVDMVWSEWLI